MPVTEDKTILQELTERSPEQKAEERRTDRAYHLISQGYWAEADALFDEVLKTEPDNQEALMGKRLISRTNNVSKRMNSLDARVNKTRGKTTDSAKTRMRRRTTLWIAIILALLGIGIAVAFSVDAIPFINAQPTPEPTVELIPTPTAMQSAEDILNNFIQRIEDSDKSN